MLEHYDIQTFLRTNTFVQLGLNEADSDSLESEDSDSSSSNAGMS